MENETKYNGTKNLKPLKNYDGMTEEEKERQREIRSLGGKASQEKRKAKKTMQETFQNFVESVIDKDTAKSLIGDMANLMDSEEMTIQSLMSVLALKIASEDGNIKGLEFIRDTSGNKPKDVQEIKADIMTESDKRLLENVAKRVNVSTDDGQNAD